MNPCFESLVPIQKALSPIYMLNGNAKYSVTRKQPDTCVLHIHNEKE